MTWKEAYSSLHASSDGLPKSDSDVSGKSHFFVSTIELVYLAMLRAPEQRLLALLLGTRTLLGTSASLLVTSALLVVTRSY